MTDVNEMTPIADGVAALPAPDPDNAFGREQERLRRTPAPDFAVPGSPFPDPRLLAANDSPTTIGQTREGRPVVVILYRGAWCPFCNIALRVYREELNPLLRSRGIDLVAVSPQTPDGSLTMQEKNDLDFTVLSDPGNQIARSLGVLTHPTDDARQLQLERGLDITSANADGTTELPMPTVAIVSADGTLKWIDVRPDYTTRTEPQEILSALDEVGL